MVTKSLNETGTVHKRNYGIDLLRIVSMLMVVCLHIVNRGGAISWCGPNSANYKLGWFIKIACYGAVNCFALISGYVMVDRLFKYHKIINLWFQIAFYTIGITALFAIIFTDLIGKQKIYNAFFPIIKNQYWYFTAYFGMYFFIPFFNRLLNVLNKKETGRLVISLVVILSIVPTLAKKDVFYTNSGYSMLWMSALYIIGAYLKKYSVATKFSSLKAWIAFALCITTTWLSQHMIEKLPFVFGGKVSKFFLVSYISPTILISSICLLIIFSKLTVANKKAIKTIGLFSSTSFGVYLIHTNPLVFSQVFNNLFSGVASQPAPLYILLIVLSAVAIFLSCSVVEWFRIKFFKKINIDNISIKITMFVAKKFATLNFIKYL